MLEALVKEESKAAVVVEKVMVQIIVNVLIAVSRATWRRIAEERRRKDHKEVVACKPRKEVKAIKAAAAEAAAEAKEEKLKIENA